MKIYTKTGDKGTTGLFGGARLPKDHFRIEAYGAVDELNSHLGLIRDLAGVEGLEDPVSWILTIQDRLFTAGSHLAAEPGKALPLPPLHDTDITFLEAAIDKMDGDLPPLRSFVLPGGHPLVSHIHIARCVCRRAERRVVTLSGQEEIHIVILPYLNRLSDMLFTLSRWYAHQLRITEIPWQPRK